MPKSIFFLAAILFIGGCERQDSHLSSLDEYIFHDEFYYEQYSDDGKYHLVPYLNEHYVRFETKYQDEVVSELLNRGFQLIEDPVVQNYIYNVSFDIPEELKYGSTVSVKGEGKIDDIPHVTYSHHLYYNTGGDIFGRSNCLIVFYDADNAEAQVKLILQYAERHGIYPLNNYKSESGGQMYLVCTNKSSGNPIELANWFVEVGGFVRAIPDSGFVSSGTDESVVNCCKCF